MKYILKRYEDNKYVAKPGMKKSYTTTLKNAQVFPNQEKAKECACGNEYIVCVDDIINDILK
jgi:hypothetical protein